MRQPMQILDYLGADRFLLLLTEIEKRSVEIEKDPHLEYRIIAKYLTSVDFENCGQERDE